jgi:transcriptional regulator with XRE-family HTH domain
MTKIGNTIRTRRLQLGLTQVQVASKSQTQQSYLSKIEAGEMANVGLEILGRIATALNVDLATLLR